MSETEIAVHRGRHLHSHAAGARGGLRPRQHRHVPRARNFWGPEMRFLIFIINFYIYLTEKRDFIIITETHPNYAESFIDKVDKCGRAIPCLRASSLSNFLKLIFFLLHAIL